MNAKIYNAVPLLVYVPGGPTDMNPFELVDKIMDKIPGTIAFNATDFTYAEYDASDDEVDMPEALTAVCKPRDEARARLDAAAPGMFAALESILADCELMAKHRPDDTPQWAVSFATRIRAALQEHEARSARANQIVAEHTSSFQAK